MIWPVAALAAVFLCFVVVYGTRLQAQIESTRDTRRTRKRRYGDSGAGTAR